MIKKNELEVLRCPTQSLGDRKKYKLFRLANGLKVLLVKNEELYQETDTGEVCDNFAAVAMCLDVGSFNDPKEVQGLSHFLEHMIFMGSEKYPKENEFDKYIKNRNGIDNAVTEVEYTMFYFKIGENHLSTALDIFSKFFVCPLMSIDSLEREREAIESEFQNDVSNDYFRVCQIVASIMAKESSCVSNFTWGNLKTLSESISSSKLYQILHDFRRKFYNSNSMNLCIQSNLNLEVLEAIVTRYFEEINPGYGDVTEHLAVNPSEDIFKPKFHEKIFYVKSLSKKRKLFMTFLLPSIECEYKNKSLDYVAYLITHEGRRGLNYFFKNKNLALHVVAKIGMRNFEGNSLFTLFTIEVYLTKEGYENIGKVLEAIFSYLLMIKMTPMTTHRELFGEFKEIKEILFNYRKEKPPLENVQELVLNMKYFNDDDIIVGKEICEEFDECMLKKCIEQINQEKFNLVILSDTHKKYDQVETWFGTEYAEVDFPRKFKQLWNERWLRNDFELPGRNKFICRKLEILPQLKEEECSNIPILIFQNNSCECFFKKDNKFMMPYGYVYVHFISPLTQASIKNLNMTSIYSMCVKHFLSDKLYPATLAGFKYKLNSVETGLILQLSGFSEKVNEIASEITKALINTDKVVDKLIFDRFKKELRKNCFNFMTNSNQLIEDLRLHLLTSNHKFYFDRFKETEKIDFNLFKEFLHNFIRSIKIKVLVQGNFTKAHALLINDIIRSNLGGEDIENFKNVESFTYQIPHGETYVKVKSLKAYDKNSIVKNYYQLNDNSLESQCLLELLVKTIREPLFNELRTQQQLGYSVSCSSKADNGILGFSTVVESQEKRNSANHVNTKIEDFLRNFLSTLNQMSESDFEITKRSIINEKRSPVIDLESEVDRNWTEIRENKYQFDRREIEARQLELLNKDALLSFFEEIILSCCRRKLSLQVLANEEEEDLLLSRGYLHLNLVSNSDMQNSIASLSQFRQTLHKYNIRKETESTGSHELTF